MAAPFGFSVGDFISAIDLSIQIVKSLRSSSMAPAECTSTIAFLGSVQHTVRKVHTLLLLHGEDDPVSVEHIQACAQTCCEQVVRFSHKLAKYQADMSGAGGTGAAGRLWKTKLKRGSAKLKCAMMAKDDAAALRLALVPQLLAMQSFLQLANSQRAELQHRGQAVLLQSAQRMELQLQAVVVNTETQATAGAESGDENGTLERDNFADGSITILPTTAASDSVLVRQVRVLPVASAQATMSAQSRKAAAEVELLVFLIALSLWRTFGRLLRAYAYMSRAPTRLLDSNIVITDTLGRRLSLPYEHFNEWSMLVARLNVAFTECAGESMVLGGRYGLYKQSGRMEMLHQYNWKGSIAKGCKVVMAVTLDRSLSDVDSCPRCGTSVSGLDSAGWATW